MLPDDTLDPTAVRYSPAGLRRLGIDPAPSPAALGRWSLKGLRGIRPETFLRGGRRYITPRALAEFFAAVTRAADGGGASASHTRGLCDSAAERELDGVHAADGGDAFAPSTRAPSDSEIERELDAEGL